MSSPKPQGKEVSKKASQPADEAHDENEHVEKGAKGEATKDMKNVTSYLNEELANRQVDADKLAKTMSFLNEEAKKHKHETLNKTMATSVDKEAVSVVMNQLEVSKTEAEKALREHNNDIVKALISIMETA
ncbi:uncharacterized protein BYT42DRAFT_567131 [Radiomyces spectabilis]|uniref:uncharacterized protein n=1 Tax=Radiomyces spectabilis TaxID=64574 RepID=UPI00221E62A9|nr:uncharacterized protein BYT42DRAFT_567131 [Radiomyces spectabilis]KAI8381598.1 hypothetical protein BYT42DRAFT_567131 [Radiomyces spectabilis]